jgi:hypothetical protein
MLPLARLAPGFVAVVAILALARRGRDTIQARPRTSTVLAIAAVAALQIAYFHIDAFSDDRARLVHVAVVLVAALSLVMAIRRHILDRRLLESLATAALLTAASLQFAYFYVDYFTDYQRRAYYPEGEVRVVLEDVIARARAAPVPAIHFWGLGGVGLQNLYWKFYLAKHGRDDLLARTTRGEERGDDARERVGQLPPGSLVVTRPSDDAAAALDPLVRAGDLTSAALFRSPDGAPIFWVLERAAR